MHGVEKQPIEANVLHVQCVEVQFLLIITILQQHLKMCLRQKGV